MARTIRTDLPASLGIDTTDPAFVAAYEDVERSADVIVRLVNRRVALGLTQADVAARMDTTQSAVSRLECSTADPHVTTLQKYARAVGWRLGLSAGPPPVDGEDDGAAVREGAATD